MGELKPPTVRPMTELLKVPSILKVWVDTLLQVPTKLAKAEQVNVDTVKYVSTDSSKYVGISVYCDSSKDSVKLTEALNYRGE